MVRSGSAILNLAAVPSLEAAGFRGDEIGRRRALFRSARTVLDALGSAGPVLSWHVPGRIEVLGKHTDYAGGRSLLATTEQGLEVVAVARSDRRLRVVDAISGECRELDLAPDTPGVRGDWSNYVATVARRLAQDFGPDLVGADLAFGSDLPIAAGVSSSSALVIAIGLGLIEVNRLDRHPHFARLETTEDLGAYFGAVENGRPFKGFGGGTGVGTLGGNQDQTAILCCRPDSLVQYRFDPVGHQRTVAFPASLTFVVAASGVRAEKTGAAIERYNSLARATARLADLVERSSPARSGTLVDRLIDDPSVAERVVRSLHQETVDPVERRWVETRMTQLLEECGTLIPSMADALERRDTGALGDLAERSQRGAELGLQNQIPETIGLVELARDLGAVAASAFGAGFGGSVWAMVGRDQADHFTAAWRGRYLDRFPEREAHARFFATRPCPPAVRLHSTA